MHKLILTTLLAVLALSVGCIRSLHPIYTEKDIVFEPGLIGQWAEDNSKEMWLFSKEGTNEYKLVYTDDKGKQGTFSASLLRIQGQMFLDFFPREPDQKGNEFYQFHLLPIHTFVSVKQIEPILQMSFPDPEWLEGHIADNPDAIKHEMLDDEIFLTASTKALQTFWLEHLDTEGAFGDPSNMKRR